MRSEEEIPNQGAFKEDKTLWAEMPGEQRQYILSEILPPERRGSIMRYKYADLDKIPEEYRGSLISKVREVKRLLNQQKP